ncbi:MAG: hypothetical protein QME75_12345 [Deltaproteobacteria bacterium]|nr:hypothetical protein [Deltaproteobacteria bacterium]
MNEEKVTQFIVNWLRGNGWRIISVDIPQAGSGLAIHIDRASESTLGGLHKAHVPDVITERNGVFVFFEVKPRFSLDDFRKVQRLRTDDRYRPGIERITGPNAVGAKFGVGLNDTASNEQKALAHSDMVDFIVLVDQKRGCRIGFQKGKLFP